MKIGMFTHVLHLGNSVLAIITKFCWSATVKAKRILVDVNQKANKVSGGVCFSLNFVVFLLTSAKTQDSRQDFVDKGVRVYSL